MVDKLIKGHFENRQVYGHLENDQQMSKQKIAEHSGWDQRTGELPAGEPVRQIGEQGTGEQSIE